MQLVEADTDAVRTKERTTDTTTDTTTDLHTDTPVVRATDTPPNATPATALALTVISIAAGAQLQSRYSLY